MGGNSGGGSTLSYVSDVLRIFEQADVFDGLVWRVRDGQVTFMATCSDTFSWGTADGEPIEPDDVELLQACLDELTLYDAEFYVGELFAARKRGMRPMRLWLDTVESHPVAALFVSAGPPRDPLSEG